MKFSLATSIIGNQLNFRPDNALILCHGYGGNKKSIALLANHWKNFLPKTIIYCPEAPFICKNLKNSYQWFYPDLKKEEILDSAISSEKKLNLFIDQIIDKNKIDNEKIFLGGFSQGGMISLQTGIKRKKKIKLILSYSGKIIDTGHLKKNISSKPKVFLFHGNQDKVVLPKFLSETKKFLQQNNFNVNTKLFKNCEHKIPTEGVKLGLEFLKKNM